MIATEAGTFVCSLCWAEFDTEADAAEHEEMEEAVSWSLDGAVDV